MSFLHPLLKNSTIYLGGAPQYIRSKELKVALGRCGTIIALSRIETFNGLTTWEVTYERIWEAEMALATLHGTELENVNPSWTVRLSHNRRLDLPIPDQSKTVLPLDFAHRLTRNHPLHGQDAQTLFALLRTVGPLVSVRVEDFAPYSNTEEYRIRVEYWDPDHAFKATRGAFASLNAMSNSPVTLRPFDPYALACWNLDGSVTEAMLHQHVASKLSSDVASVFILEQTNTRPKHAIVVFYTEKEAAEALSVLNGTLLASKTLSVNRVKFLDKTDMRAPPPPNGAQRRSKILEGSVWDKDAQPSPSRGSFSPVKINDSYDPVILERVGAATQKRITAEQKGEEAKAVSRDIVQEQAGLQEKLHDVQVAHKAITEQCKQKAAELFAAQKARQEAERREAALRREKEELEQRWSKSAKIVGNVEEGIKDVENRKEVAERSKQEARELMQSALEEERREVDGMQLMWLARAEEIAAQRLADDARLKQKEAEQQAREAEERRRIAERLEKEAKEKQKEAGRVLEALKNRTGQERVQTKAEPKKSQKAAGYIQEALKTETKRASRIEVEASSKEKVTSNDVKVGEERGDQKTLENGSWKAKGRIRQSWDAEELRERIEREAREKIERKERFMRAFIQAARDRVQQVREDKAAAASGSKAEGSKEEEEHLTGAVTRRAEEQQKQRTQALQLLSPYTYAVSREVDRCSARDRSLWAFHTRNLWSDQRAFQRFKRISDEFDNIKFTAEQPLTLQSVPWPLLCYPDDITLDLIEWGAIEAFFTAVKSLVEDGEYKTLVEKTQRRFHPDKWKSRRLLVTIVDEDLREHMEAAGNRVAQTMTPLWHASKSS